MFVARKLPRHAGPSGWVQMLPPRKPYPALDGTVSADVRARSERFAQRGIATPSAGQEECGIADGRAENDPRKRRDRGCIKPRNKHACGDCRDILGNEGGAEQQDCKQKRLIGRSQQRRGDVGRHGSGCPALRRKALENRVPAKPEQCCRRDPDSAGECKQLAAVVRTICVEHRNAQRREQV